MPIFGAELRRETAADRRPVTATASLGFAVAAPPSAGAALQLRFGNAGTQALLEAQLAPRPLAPAPVAPEPGTAEAPGAPAAEATQPTAAPGETAPATAPAPAAPAGAAAPAAKPAGKKPVVPGAEGEAPPAPVEGEAAPAAEAAADPQAQLAPLNAEIAARSETQAAHPPAKRGIDSAEAAAKEPKRESRRHAAHAVSKRVAAASKQAAEKPAGAIEAEKFKKALKAKLESLMPQPKSAKDAQKALQSGTATAVSGDMRGELQQQKTQAVGAVPQAVETEPQPDQFQQPKAPDLRVEQPGARPAPIDPAGGVPPPVPDSRLNMDENRAPADAELAQGHVTADRLATSPDPSVAETGREYQDAKAESERAPGEIRADEAQIRKATEARAAAGLVQGLAGMAMNRDGRFANVGGKQLDTQASHEKERQDITAKLESIQKDTREAVDKILKEMEVNATDLFEAGLRRALLAFEAERAKLEDEMRRKRQAEWSKYVGGWIADLSYYFDLDEESVNKTVDAARAAYQREVDKTIDQVAAYVGEKLAAAKARAAKGEAEADDFVAKLEPGLQEIGRQARAQVQVEFNKLSNEIDARRDALIDKMGKSYAESLKEVEARIEAFREANKSWWQRIKEKIKRIVKIILEFKDLLFSILKRAAGIIDAILSDPIGFLGNLVDGVKLGLSNFVDHIGEHLKQALLTWMFGALAAAGIHIPKSFGAKEIIGLILEVLGLTYQNIRARAVNLLGEPMVARLEQAAEIFKILITEGPAGLWNFLMDKLDALKEQVLGQVREMVITQVIKAGIMWVIGLLNPASAFLKACKAIYDIVMFFIERGRELVDLINAILDTLAAIVGGNLTRMAAAVEGALAKALPVVIGFLASLLGLGGISEKIQEVIAKIQNPVNKAIDWLIGKAVTVVQKAGAAIAGVFKRKDKEDHPDDPEKQAKLEAGFQALIDQTNGASKDGDIEIGQAKKIAANVKKDHPVFKSIKVVDGGDSWDYEYKASDGKIEGAKKGFDFENVHRAKLRAYKQLVEKDLTADVEKARDILVAQRNVVVDANEPKLLVVGAAMRESIGEEEIAKDQTMTIELSGLGKFSVTYFGGTNLFVHGIGTYAEIESDFEAYLKELADKKGATRGELLAFAKNPGRDPKRLAELDRAARGFSNFVSRFKILREVAEVVRSRTQVVNAVLSSRGDIKELAGGPLTSEKAASTAARVDAVTTGEADPLKKASTKPPRADTKIATRYEEFVNKTIKQLEKELVRKPDLAEMNEDQLTAYFVTQTLEYLGQSSAKR